MPTIQTPDRNRALIGAVTAAPRIRPSTWKEKLLDIVNSIGIEPIGQWEAPIPAFLPAIGRGLAEQPLGQVAGAVGSMMDQGFRGQMGQEDSPWAGPASGQMIGAAVDVPGVVRHGITKPVVTERLRELEQIYHGGVADLGNSEAANVASMLSEYPRYARALQSLAKRKLGDRVTAWRAISPEALADWRSGADMGAQSFTTNRRIAETWPNLAGNQGKRFVLVEADVEPHMIMMRGKPEEAELIVDGNAISAHQLRVLGNLVAKDKQ